MNDQMDESDEIPLSQYIQAFPDYIQLLLNHWSGAFSIASLLLTALIFQYDAADEGFKKLSAIVTIVSYFLATFQMLLRQQLNFEGTIRQHQQDISLLNDKILELQGRRSDITMELASDPEFEIHWRVPESARKEFPDSYLAERGLPFGVTLTSKVLVKNRGQDDGRITCDYSSSESVFAPIFTFVNVTPVEISCPGRSWREEVIQCRFVTGENDPRTFSVTSRALQEYQIVLRYSGFDVEGPTETRQLRIGGDFRALCHMLVASWEKMGYFQLARLAEGEST